MLALPRRASFWPLSMAYISIIITHVTNYNLFQDIDHLWAASMYCIYTCLSDSWVLIFIVCCTSALCGLEYSYIPLLLISSLLHPLKSHHPCSFPPSLLNATLFLISPSSSGSGCCPFEDLLFTF